MKVELEKVDEKKHNFLCQTCELEFHTCAQNWTKECNIYCVGMKNLKYSQKRTYKGTYEPRKLHLHAISSIVDIRPEVLKFQVFV